MEARSAKLKKTCCALSQKQGVRIGTNGFQHVVLNDGNSYTMDIRGDVGRTAMAPKPAPTDGRPSCSNPVPRLQELISETASRSCSQDSEVRIRRKAQTNEVRKKNMHFITTCSTPQGACLMASEPVPTIVAGTNAQVHYLCRLAMAIAIGTVASLRYAAIGDSENKRHKENTNVQI